MRSLSSKLAGCWALVALLMGGTAVAQTILPVVEDTWIHGTESTSASGGIDTRLGICPVVDYWIYLKFDLSELACAIDGAELRMVRTGGTNPTEISLYPITEDGWSETTLTGVNRPEPTSPPSGTGIAYGEERLAEGYDRWTSTALADLVRAEAAGDGTLSIMLREDHGVMFDVRYFHSGEAAVDDARKPRLVLETAAPEATGLGMSRNGGVTLHWESAGPLAGYDVIAGPLDQLRVAGVGSASCLVDDLAAPSLGLADGDPAPGEGSYYLVRVEDPCGIGSYGVDSARTTRIPSVDCAP